jgi:hypothetical protein
MVFGFGHLDLKWDDDSSHLGTSYSLCLFHQGREDEVTKGVADFCDRESEPVQAG